MAATIVMNIWKVSVEFDECFALLQKALQLVRLVEERLQSSVSLWPLLPRQLLRNRELQLVDGKIQVPFNFSMWIIYQKHFEVTVLKICQSCA
jgi:hypothetical protein